MPNDNQEQLITLELTRQELTHIRVAMLHRLDKLKSNTNQSEDNKRSYEACMTLMTDGGKLWQAMRISQHIVPAKRGPPDTV